MLMESVSRLLLLFSLLPSDSSPEQKYAVIFDGGSTGSRVHVFRFDNNMALLPIGNDYKFFLATTPGLSAYESDPKAAAESLRPLLEQAEAVVPQTLRPTTPLRLGATAGLRMLPGHASEDILNAVRAFFKSESSLNSKDEWVTVLDGNDEGAFIWVAINYLLGTFGKGYSKTVGVVDLGGGSVQMAYAVSAEAAANAPDLPTGAYVVDKDVLGTKYHLYTHSFLNYGLKAARAQSLKLSGANGNPCVTNGYIGTYEYSGTVYAVSAPKSGTNLRRCSGLIRKTLNIDGACSHRNCSFDGIWNEWRGRWPQKLVRCIILL
ncbi:hypothetical protein ACS0TY_019077 [Phlomoides rotata]